jgi:hypothetical protein
VIVAVGAIAAAGLLREKGSQTRPREFPAERGRAARFPS